MTEPSADGVARFEVLRTLGSGATGVEVIWTLTCLQSGRLGQYGSAITDLTVQGPLAAFQAELETLEATIAERNRTERASAPYLYLAPSRIPNSTNI